MRSHPTRDPHGPDPAHQVFYDLNPSHRFTQHWADPQQGWRWMEAEVTLGDRVQRALAGGENLPLDRGEDPGDVRDLRADYIATLARQAPQQHRHRPGPARDHTAELDRTRHADQRRTPER
jgi:hypothetical protein